MPELTTDIVILGSGFGGSLLALILARAGKSVAMVDRSRHPKFAIGESSTPLADRTLAQMADAYGIPELRPLCHWGSLKRERPQLLCGKKRGFTYFDQTTDEDLTGENFDARRLLVSASVDDEHSDTHWLRSDVDQFIFQLAKASGVVAFEGCQYELGQQDGQWTLEGSAAGNVDASLRRSAFCLLSTVIPDPCSLPGRRHWFAKRCSKVSECSGSDASVEDEFKIDLCSF